MENREQKIGEACFSMTNKRALLSRIDTCMATTGETPWRSDGQEEEINLLRNHFKDDIRILSSIGQFSYILKIRADQYDVSLTLQLDRKSKGSDAAVHRFVFSYDRILSVETTRNHDHSAASHTGSNSPRSTTPSILQRNTAASPDGGIYLHAFAAVVQREQYSSAVTEH